MSTADEQRKWLESTAWVNEPEPDWAAGWQGEAMHHVEDGLTDEQRYRLWSDEHAAWNDTMDVLAAQAERSVARAEVWLLAVGPPHRAKRWWQPRAMWWPPVIFAASLALYWYLYAATPEALWQPLSLTAFLVGLNFVLWRKKLARLVRRRRYDDQAINLSADPVYVQLDEGELDLGLRPDEPPRGGLRFVVPPGTDLPENLTLSADPPEDD